MANAIAGKIDARWISQMNQQQRRFIDNTPVDKLKIVQITLDGRPCVVVGNLIAQATYYQVFINPLCIIGSIVGIITDPRLSKLEINVFGNDKTKTEFTIGRTDLPLVQNILKGIEVYNNALCIIPQGFEKRRFIKYFRIHISIEVGGQQSGSCADFSFNGVAVERAKGIRPFGNGLSIDGCRAY